uniref:Uncharacterized protein n=1 Tax=Strigamia maritima TaxID=126957 RepID=T1IHC7_STRMM
MQIDRKNEINGFLKQDDKLSDIEEDDDDAIIMQADHQLLNSPTSSHKSDLDERRNSVQCVEDKIINSLKRKFSDKLDEPKIETHQKLPAKRNLDNPTIGDRRSERRCSNGNTVCMSPYVVVNRLENVKSSLCSTKIASENEDTIEVEGDFLNMENDDDGDLNLTLSDDDDTLSLNAPGFLAHNLESKLMNLSEEDIEIDVHKFS